MDVKLSGKLLKINPHLDINTQKSYFNFGQINGSNGFEIIPRLKADAILKKKVCGSRRFEYLGSILKNVFSQITLL